MSTTPILGLTELEPSQAQPHVPINEALRVLSVLLAGGAISRSVDVQPSGADEGDVYVLPMTVSGEDWEAFDPDDIVWFADGGWHRIAPLGRPRLWVDDEEISIVWTGTEWRTHDMNATFGQTVEILAVTDVNSPGAWFAIPALAKSIIIWITGTKTIAIEGSANGTDALPTPIVPDQIESGVHASGDVVHYLRANPSAGAGTARVEVMY